MKSNKQGVSLIVLIITIIVMIILASAVIISLSDVNIFENARDAVSKTNLATYKNIATMAWSDAYLAKRNDPTVDIEARVLAALAEYGVTRDKFLITVDNQGATVEEYTAENMTLGNLVSNSDLGKTVDYTVTVDGTEYKDWQVLYEDEANGYVFLIVEDSITGVDYESLSSTITEQDISLYNKFKLGKTGFPITVESQHRGADFVKKFIANYNSFANGTDYMDTNGDSYVVGAIGSPTIELFAAAYNEINGKTITPLVDLSYKGDLSDYDGSTFYMTDGSYGYMLNTIGNTQASMLVNTAPFMSGASNYFLASPTARTSPYWGDGVLYANFKTDSDNGSLSFEFVDWNSSMLKHMTIRPVVCLKSSTPAIYGTTTDFTLTVSGN